MPSRPYAHIFETLHIIKVAACGVCHTDLHVMKGDVRFPTPAVLGHELSGITQAVGSGVADIRPGDRVVCSFIMPCGSCRYCVQGRDDLCIPFYRQNRLQGCLYDGTTRLRRHDGSPVWMYSMAGLAEYAVAPAGGVFKVPDTISLENACIMGCAVFTAYGAVKHQGRVSPGDAVAVFAIGGVGVNVVQIARVFGASNVIAVDIRPDKLELAKKLGASHVVNGAKEDVPQRILELTDGRGVNVAVEALGHPQTILQAYNSLADGGRLVLVGLSNMTTTFPIEINRTVRRGVTIVGSFGARSRSDMPTIISLVERGLINIADAVSQSYSLDEVNEAYDALERGTAVGRSIIVMK